MGPSKNYLYSAEEVTGSQMPMGRFPVTGLPLSEKAALDAVRQWKYKPYSLNGQPTEIETEVTVNFTLNS